METSHSYISPNITQLDSPVSEQHEADNFDVKLQYLVDIAQKNFQNNEEGEEEASFKCSSTFYSTECSPQEMQNYKSINENFNNMNPSTVGFSLQNGLPSPGIMESNELQSMNFMKAAPTGVPKLSNGLLYTPGLTPIEPMEYNWENVQYQGNELSTFSRVLRRTEDLQVTPTNEEANYLQNQFISQEIYPQVITTDVSYTPISNPSSSIFSSSSSSSSPMTPGTAITPRKNKVQKRPRKVRPKPIYDESAKPIAQQLQEDKKIWNKICETKKKGIYKCTHCSGIFKGFIDLARHIDENKIARQHKCPFKDCPWSIIGLPRRAEVRRHCAAQHSFIITYPDDKDTGVKEGYVTTDKFKCEYEFCDRCFKRKDSQQRHEKLVHLNPDSRFNKRIQKLKAYYKTDDVTILTRGLEKKKRSNKKDEDEN